MPIRAVQLVAAIMLLIPLIMLATQYGTLPDRLPVMRGIGGRPPLMANKSLLVVFRIPIIGVLTAAAIEMMRRHSWGVADHFALEATERLWITLLLTASLKSLWEGCELAFLAVENGPVSSWLRTAAMATVLIGLLAAAWQVPRAWPILQQRQGWRLTQLERANFVALAVIYCGVAILPVILAARS